jgi:hypothetical protein
VAAYKRAGDLDFRPPITILVLGGITPSRGRAMRGDPPDQRAVWSYVRLEERVPLPPHQRLRRPVAAHARSESSDRGGDIIEDRSLIEGSEDRRSCTTSRPPARSSLERDRGRSVRADDARPHPAVFRTLLVP